ncbi:MAG: toll/interleukin-1 receptor domain-containing protein [Anaerolineae bacterium]|nr:toll/interleukin-1 receptor domain-containing protein [Anaerolineae bacterium]
MPKIFVSHTSDDDDLSRRIADRLDLNGIETNRSAEIRPGEYWANYVHDYIADSDAVIVVIKDGSTQSEQVQREIEIARTLEKPTYYLTIQLDEGIDEVAAKRLETDVPGTLRDMTDYMDGLMRRSFPGLALFPGKGTSPLPLDPPPPPPPATAAADE